jgi:flavin reductase (DIM6/NTAB) family NADH-FMN oxidoreductase RutF
MDANTKKLALRSFTYGLFAVSCADLGEVNIFTANWITQASFEPPLLALSVENDSKSLPMIQRSRKFTVNVLRSGQRELDAGILGEGQPLTMNEAGFRHAG